MASNDPPIAPAAPPEAAATCPYCGMQRMAEARFCPGCGRALETGTAAPSAAALPAPAPASPAGQSALDGMRQVIALDQAHAHAALAVALAAAGATVTARLEPRQLTFQCTAAGQVPLIGNRMLYDGEVSVVPLGAQSSEAQFSLTPNWAASALAFAVTAVPGLIALALPQLFAGSGLAGIVLLSSALSTASLVWQFGWAAPQKIVAGLVRDVRAPPASLSAQPPIPPAPPDADLSGRLQRLAALHRDGVLSDTEYAAKKAEILKDI